MRDERSLVVGGLVLLLTACSAGQGQKGSETGGGSSVGGASGTNGQGGVGATGVGGSSVPVGGGSSAAGGMGASSSGGANTGGSGLTSGTNPGGASGTANGGVSGAGAVPAGGDAGMGGQVACQDLTVVPTPLVPTVLILVDNSSSMFETMPPAWPDLKSALMDADGVVQALQAKIRFGFVSYKGSTVASTEGSAACADMTNRVLPALNNHDAIATVYNGITWNHEKWETPTGYAITVATQILAADNPDPPGPKFILLVTDGNPNTCATLDPQCGQDFAIKAAQTAFAPPNNIQTIVFGVGDIVAQPNNGCPTSGRCGGLHLQDMANAGVGNPVDAPPENFKYEQCNIGQMLTATYLPQGTAATVNEPYSTASNRAELLTKLTNKLTNVVSCTIQLDATVNATADPSLARVTVNGDVVPYNVPDGWILESTRDKITLQGAACATFRGGASVNVVFPCQNGRPIGM